LFFRRTTVAKSKEVKTGSNPAEFSKEGYDSKDLEVGGRIRLEWILREMGWGGMDSIGLAQDRDRWRVLVNTATNLRVP
jgi:hypothetical protein